MRLRYFDFGGSGAWSDCLAGTALAPVLDPAGKNGSIVARDWVRFTVRVDPLTQKSDAWFNGRLVIADAARSPDCLPYSPAPSFYVQGSASGPPAFDDFQLCASNPLFGDQDADGLPDDWEPSHGLNISVNDREEDHDGDGLTNLEESIPGTNPNSTDTDADSMADLLWRHTTVSQSWLAEKLHLQSAANVSQLMRRAAPAVLLNNRCLPATLREFLKAVPLDTTP